MILSLIKYSLIFHVICLGYFHLQSNYKNKFILCCESVGTILIKASETFCSVYLNQRLIFIFITTNYDVQQNSVITNSVVNEHSVITNIILCHVGRYSRQINPFITNKICRSRAVRYNRVLLCAEVGEQVLAISKGSQYYFVLN